MEKHLFLGDEAEAQAAIDRPSQRKGGFTAVGARMKKLQWKLRWV